MIIQASAEGSREWWLAAGGFLVNDAVEQVVWPGLFPAGMRGEAKTREEGEKQLKMSRFARKGKSKAAFLSWK